METLPTSPAPRCGTKPASESVPRAHVHTNQCRHDHGGGGELDEDEDDDKDLAIADDGVDSDGHDSREDDYDDDVRT